jgi:hypothetical protein
MDRATLRDVIRRKLDDGDLPTKAPNEMDVGVAPARPVTHVATRSNPPRVNTN